MPQVVAIVEGSRIARLAAKKLGTPNVALTIGNKIYLHNATKAELMASKTWLCHELKHVQQFRENGFITFIIKYLWESFRKGYYNNKWEVEARKAETDFSLLDEFEIV